MTTTERANGVIENVMRRLKACNVKEPKLIKFRMFTQNGNTHAMATISVSAVGTTNPKYRESVCDIIRFAATGDDVFGTMVRLRSETDGIVMIDVFYNIGSKIDIPRYELPSTSEDNHQKNHSNNETIFGADHNVCSTLKELGIQSTVKTGSNTSNARTGTNMNSCILKLELPYTFSRNMVKHIPKIVRDEMRLKYADKHVNANILDLHDNIYLYVSVVTKNK